MKHGGESTMSEVEKAPEVPGIWALLAAARWVLEEPRWLVWSNQHGAWWAPNSCGYRLNVAEAGRYTLTEAIAKTRLRSVVGVPPELVVPSPELLGNSALFVSGPEAGRPFLAQPDGDGQDWPQVSGTLDFAKYSTMPQWWTFPETSPPPHAGEWLVERPGVGPFVATVCYGMHSPWWVPAIGGPQAQPVPMMPGDRWRPWSAPAHEAMKPPSCETCQDERIVDDASAKDACPPAFVPVIPCQRCVEDRCVATHDPRMVPPRTVRCFRERGHDGAHKAYEGRGVSVEWDTCEQRDVVDTIEGRKARMCHGSAGHAGPHMMGVVRS